MIQESSNLIKLQKGEKMGRIVTFGELITFSAGTNKTRLSKDIPEDSIYTLEDFDRDLTSSTIEGLKENFISNKGKSVNSSAGDVVISMTRNQAAIVSLHNGGKYLNSNFLKCAFDRNKLYPWYFCYLFNESVFINQQIKKLQQGTIGCINRLTINMIGSLEFELEDISQQKIIGELYHNMLIRESLALKHINDMRKYTLEIIKKVDNN